MSQGSNYKTLSIIKPHAVKENLIGAINARIEKSGFIIVAQKMIKMNEDLAKKFYAVHSEKPFFQDLVRIMSSGPVVVQVLASSSKDVVKDYRDLMGATNPENALKGTLRADYGHSLDENAVHGSDSDENAQIEIDCFFDKNEIFLR